MSRSALSSLRALTALLVCLLVASCADEDAPATADPVRSAARAEAARAACLTAELERRAAAELADLEQMLGALPAGSPASAPAEFQRVLAQHAQLQAGAAALVDSALSAATAADSARYAERAATFRTRAPEAGTLEANARAAYQRALAQLAADPDHPCNWD